MEANRREFLKGTAWMGAAAMAAGCMSAGRKMCDSTGAPMHGFTVPAMKKVRVGIIGVGGRGIGAVQRIAQIPGCELTAMSDINPKMLDRAQNWLTRHGGMDFIMDLRWAYCLQNGLTLDTDVYDLATCSSIVELSERSINARSEAIDFPDYTRGGWKTAKPFTVDEIDMNTFDFKTGVIHAKDAQKT